MIRRNPNHAIAALGLTLLVLASGACSTPAPSPPISSPEPTRVALASPTPTPAPLPSPTISCQEPQAIDGVSYETPTCESAVQAALVELAHVDGRISALDFRYGMFCPPGYYCVLALPPFGHVVVTLADGDRYVVNVRHEAGEQASVIQVRFFPATEKAASGRVSSR